MIIIKLQQLLDDKNVSQRALARELDIRQDTINKMCNNNAVFIRIDHLDKICAYFNCSLEDILEYSKESSFNSIDK